MHEASRVFLRFFCGLKKKTIVFNGGKALGNFEEGERCRDGGMKKQRERERIRKKIYMRKEKKRVSSPFE